MKKKALLLLSGGLDSATTGAVAREEGFDSTAVTFSYGQRHRVELFHARSVAGFLGITNHVQIDIPAHVFSATALIEGSGIEVPKNRNVKSDGIPETYVPARNILFLSYALAIGESRYIYDIFIGVNAMDYSGYPDCRPEFIRSFESMANTGTRTGVEGRGFTIHAPLIHLKKSEIITLGTGLGLDYSITHSCYDPGEDGTSCGECDSCIIRKKGFVEAGIPDPTKYRK